MSEFLFNKGEGLYNHRHNLNLCNKSETFEYNATPAIITGAIRVSSKERLCQELGFKYLILQRWLTLKAPTPQNAQTHSNDSSANC